MFSKSLRHRDRTRRYSIVPTTDGWEVREEEVGVAQDSRIIRQTHYTDWHRVERARRAFTMEMQDLRKRGWAEVG
jgi:hypothetical protein